MHWYIFKKITARGEATTSINQDGIDINNTTEKNEDKDTRGLQTPNYSPWAGSGPHQPLGTKTPVITLYKVCTALL